MSAGWRSPGLRSATLPMALSGLIMFHRPERSGLPSAVRGAGAVRFGLPSAVRGMPGVRYCAHCAASGVTNAVKVIAVVKIFIRPKCPPIAHYYTPKDRRMAMVAGGLFLALIRSRHEPVPHPANRQQVARLGGIFLDVAPQPHHEVIDGARVG